MNHIFIFFVFIIPLFRSGKSDALIAAGVTVCIWLLMKSNQTGLGKRNAIHSKLFKYFQFKVDVNMLNFQLAAEMDDVYIQFWRLIPSLCGSQCCCVSWLQNNLDTEQTAECVLILISCVTASGICVDSRSSIETIDASQFRSVVGIIFVVE